MVYVRDLMNLTYFRENNLQLIAGAKGLGRVVTRPNLPQLITFFDQWMANGEFLIISGIGIDLNPLENMLTFIERANASHAAGIAFLISDDFIRSVPEEAVRLADRLNIPLFTLSWTTSFGKALNEVYDYIVRKQMEETTVAEIMQNILSLDVDEEYMKQRAGFYGYDLSVPHGVILFELPACQDLVRTNPEKHDSILNHIKNHILYAFPQYLHSSAGRMMALGNYNSVIFFLPCTDREELTAAIRKVCRSAAAAYPGISIQAGIGKIYQKINDYKKSLHEARSAIKAARTGHQELLFYDQLGIFRLLMDGSSEALIKDYIQENLGPILNYDAGSSSPLLPTLEAFISHNCSLAQTSKALFIHRNTLILRLERIRSILQADFNDSSVRRELSNALYLRHFVDECI